MNLNESGFYADHEKQEIFPSDYEEFPFLCWTRSIADKNQYLNHCVPWHWHPALELDYVLDGMITIHAPSETFTAKKGDIFFINTEILHEIQFHKEYKNCSLCALLFDMHLLSGMYNSRFEQKYLRPITDSRTLSVYVISGNNGNQRAIIEKFHKIRKISQEETPGYEFEIRAELSRLWLLLLEETKDLRASTPGISGTNINRLKTMMDFIEHHYMEKISLDDIAASASLSVRECSRCFNHCIRKSPIVYLNEYRLRIAAQMLIRTEDSILSVSENCGFHSASYFSKSFRETFCCTPKEYRKNGPSAPGRP